MWVFTYCEGWGQRGQRRNISWYFTREPSKAECLKILNRYFGYKRADIAWFSPQNSGLLTISKLKVEF